MPVSFQFPVTSYQSIDIRYSERRRDMPGYQDLKLETGHWQLGTELETGDWKLETDPFA